MLAVPTAQRWHEGPSAAPDMAAREAAPYAVGGGTHAAGPEVRGSQRVKGWGGRWVQMGTVGHE